MTQSFSSAKIRCAVSGFLVVLALCARHACAQVPPSDAERAEASAHFDLGLAHAERAEFRQAAEEFAHAHRISREPSVLYNLGMAHAAAGQPVEAAAALTSYLASEQNQPDEDERARISAEIERQQGRFGWLQVEIEPAGALLFVDDHAIAPNTRIALTIGEHRVAAKLEGYDAAARVLTIRAREQSSLELTLTRLAPASTSSQDPVPVAAAISKPWHPVAFGTAGVGAAAGIAALVLYLVSDSQFDSWKRDKADLIEDTRSAARRPLDATSGLALQARADDSDQRLRTIHRLDSTALALGIGAGVLVLGGAALFLATPRQEQRASQSPALTWNVLPTGLSVRANF